MVICVANQKGGVGKTTTAVNLAVCLCRGAGTVLAVDCDPQATMTRQLGLASGRIAVTLVDVLAGVTATDDAIVSNVIDGLDVLPGARALSGVEMTLVGELGRERFLADALESVAGRYEAVVIDTPPNLGLLTVNALLCATTVIAPVSCEDGASVQGLVELRATLSKLSRLRGSEPQLLAVLTRWAPARIMAQVIDASLAELGLAPAARVPCRAAVGQSGAERVPIALSAGDGCVALAYEHLADQVRVVVGR